MINEVEEAFLASIHMLQDGVGKIPDNRWREGCKEYLIPARIAYHILMGIEWFVSNVPPREHIATRHFHDKNAAGELAPIETLPDRQQYLEDLSWITDQACVWFSTWKQEEATGINNPFRLKKALYFLRHTQHHIGEFSAVARLMNLARPSWEFLAIRDLSVVLDTDGPKGERNG